MLKSNVPILPLAELESGVESDAFVLLVKKELQHTKDGKQYYKVVFRDAIRELPTVPIWSDSPHFLDCQKEWTTGHFYKIRVVLRSTKAFGQQLEVRRLREVTELDKRDGFDPNACRPTSPFSSESMYDEILAIAKTHLGKGKLLNLITRIFKDNRKALLERAASRHHHHTVIGGLLEHTLTVLKIAVFLADYYTTTYSKDAIPHSPSSVAFSKPLVVAGAILHDLGKIREMMCESVVSTHTVEGELIGHSVLGRDLVRDYAKEVELDEPTRIHLEHIVLSHQRFPDWGAPKPPMSLEALLVHSADSTDALFGAYQNALLQEEGTSESEITTRKGPLGFPLFRGFTSV